MPLENIALQSQIDGASETIIIYGEGGAGVDDRAHPIQHFSCNKIRHNG